MKINKCRDALFWAWRHRSRLEQLKKMKNKWKKIEIGGNEVLAGKGFYISYNPDTNASFNGLGSSLNMLGGLMGGLESDGRSETALAIKGKERISFLILNGDFRKDYEKVFSKGLAACKKFYESKKEQFGSKWSN